MKEFVGPQGISMLNVKYVCPYGQGNRGEYNKGQLVAVWNAKGDEEIGLSVYTDSEYVDEDEDGNTWDRCAEIIMTKDEAIALAELLIKSVKHADSL